MKTRLLLAGLLLLLSAAARGQSYDLIIHFADGSTVAIPQLEIRRLTFAPDTSGVDNPDDPALPPAFRILRSYPNPFNPMTTVEYETPAAQDVTVRVYDLHGALIKELLRETQPAGLHQAVWNGTDADGARVASGVYLCLVECGAQALSRQLILVK